MSNGRPVVNNLETWIRNNEKFFLPPVCNKMMHNEGQMKSFFVGGPNQRKDYHIECGEELFYQRKGDMVLKVVERGQHRDILIKEGQMFLLPSHIAHSPQRYENTVGLVIERERADHELDGLRYFIERDGKATIQSLYEEWFHCEDLGSQLGPIIKRFFASEQYKTGNPLPGTIPERPPIELDSEIVLEDPFDFRLWLKQNREEIDREGFKPVFRGNHQFQVYVYGVGERGDMCFEAETWIEQLEGESTVTTGSHTTRLGLDNCLLVPKGQRFSVSQEKGSLTFVAYQDPTKSTTWAK